MTHHFKVLVRHAGIWARTLHIYASMAGFLLVLLFAVTGITLNHQDAGWGEPSTRSFDVTISADAAKGGETSRVEAALQAAMGIATPSSSFKAYDDEIDVAFHSPGRRIQAIVERATGHTKVVWETRGGIGIINDLHKGTETGSGVAMDCRPDGGAHRLQRRHRHRHADLSAKAAASRAGDDAGRDRRHARHLLVVGAALIAVAGSAEH